MMRQVSRPVRRAGKRAERTRSQPTWLQRSRNTFLKESFLNFFAFKRYVGHTISLPRVRQQYPRVKRDTWKVEMQCLVL